MESKLYEPRVLGKGITIEKTPTEPNHGVRLVDLQGYVRVTVAILTDATVAEIPLTSTDYFVQCFDVDKQIFQPNNIQEIEGKIVVDFLLPQSGTVKVLFIGGDGGD